MTVRASLGAMNTTFFIGRATQLAPSGFMNSRSPASPTHSPHRTGAPIARSRSTHSTSSPSPLAAASHAATQPAGPAPTTSTSSLRIHHREGAHGAGRDALHAPGARPGVHHQPLAGHVDRLGRAERHAQAARVAYVVVHDGDLAGTAGWRHAGQVIPVERRGQPAPYVACWPTGAAGDIVVSRNAL